jgi:hypothetical protein
MRIADACIEGLQRREMGDTGDEFEFGAGQTTYSVSPDEPAPGEEAEAEVAAPAAAEG